MFVSNSDHKMMKLMNPKSSPMCFTILKFVKKTLVFYFITLHIKKKKKN